MKLIDKFHLVTHLSRFKLETESFRSYLGVLWWFFDPLFMAATYYLLFSVIMRRGGTDFIFFLFLGVFFWRWLDNTIAKASTSVIGQTNLLKKIYVEKDVLVFAEATTVLVKFFLILSVVYLVYTIKFGFFAGHLFLPIVLGAQFILALGVGFFLASIVPLVPDIRLGYSYGMKLLFYPSGILFSLDRLPAKVSEYVQMNPLVGLFGSYRNILMYNEAPVWWSLLTCSLVGVIFFLVGKIILKKYDRVYPKFLH